MISSGALEKQGIWRSILLVIIFAFAFFPALPLLLTTLTEEPSSAQGLWLSGFGVAVCHSMTVAISVVIASLLLGVPAGCSVGLYDFPGRRTLLSLLALPLLIPSFLLAIGLSQLRIYLGLPEESFLSGWTGTVLAFTASALPLVLFMSLLSVRSLSKSQIEAVRLVGGEVLLFRYAIRSVFPAALLVAALAGILTLSDPGPGQILGYPGAPYEILVSFSALYDFALAARQCAALTVVVIIISTPIAIFIAPSVATGLLGRDLEPAPLVRKKCATCIALVSLSTIVFLSTVLPLVGIIRPLFSQFPLERAFAEVSRTIGNTFIYAFISGVAALVLGFAAAIAVGREDGHRRLTIIALFLLLSLPPSLNALGIIKIGTAIPAWLDPLMRSKFTVGMTQAVRFLPIATILVMRAFGATSPSQALVASVHGVPLSLYLWRVLGPLVLPSALIACTIVALLATGDIGTVLLIRPPGADSLPVQIFTIMANAPESLVSALCFFYIFGAVGLLMLGWTVAEKVKAA